MIDDLLIFIGIIIFIILLMKILKIKWKLIIGILINTFIGGCGLFLVNYIIPQVDLKIDIVNSLFVGFFGVFALIVLLVIYFIR